MRLHLPVAVALVALSLAGCSSCDKNKVDDDDSTGAVRADGGDVVRTDGGTTPDSGPVVTPDAGIRDAGTPDAWVEPRVLAFQGTSPVTVFFGAVQELSFKVTTPGGSNVSGAVVNFAQSGTAGALNVAQVTTGSDGKGTVRFTAGQTVGSVGIIATTDRAPQVSIQLNVQQNPKGNLAVTLTSATRIQVTRAELLFYASFTPPTCTQLAVANPLPTAAFNADFTTIPSTRTFPDLTTGHKVTILAAGYSAGGYKIANTCVENITIVGGANTPAAVTLQQLPSTLPGDYDVLLHFNMGSALPHPYDTYLAMVGNILGDPAGYAVYQALVQADANFNSTFVHYDADNNPNTPTVVATYEYVAAHPTGFSTWKTLRDYMDSTLRTQLNNVRPGLYDTITTIGGDVYGVVADFEAGARYHVVLPPTGTSYQIDERWNDMVFTWRYGCPEGDQGCARRPVQLDNVNMSPVTSTYAAFVAHAPLTGTPGETERWKVEPELHPINLKYGAVVLIALNYVIFPNLPEGVRGNNLSEVLANIIPCDTIAQWIVTNTGVGNANSLEQLCGSGLNYGAGLVEQELLSLSAGANPELVGKTEAGVTGGGVFYLVDANHDLTTELVKDLEMHVGWTDPNDPQFSADINAPITGHGRLKASACGTDADCTTNRICTPIASYLEVRMLENDCRPQVGTGVGLAACTLDSQCQAGLCVGVVGNTPGFCYEACAGTGTCATGTCEADVAAMNLDAVLTGLGAATTDACVPQ